MHADRDRHEPAVLLTTILVSYNTRELTIAALESLADATSSVGSQVIVVDNASADGSVDAIRAEFPYVELIDNKENLGFAKAVNQALRSAIGQYVMLLNPDCIVEPNAPQILIGYLESHPDVGMVAPLVTAPSGRLNVLSAGYLPTTRRLAVHFFGLNRLPVVGPRMRGLNLRQRWAAHQPMEVEWVSGACLVVSRALMEDLHGLNERWFMYAEDMDFGARVRERNLKVVHLPAVQVSHIGGASTDGRSTLWIDNLEDFYIDRFRPRWISLLTWRVVFTLGLAGHAMAYRMRALVDRADAGAWRTQSQIWLSYTRRSLRPRGESRPQ